MMEYCQCVHYVSLYFLWLVVADLYNKTDNSTDTSNLSFSTIYYCMYQTRTYISISFCRCIFCDWKIDGEVVVSFGLSNGRSYILKFLFSNICLITNTFIIFMELFGIYNRDFILINCLVDVL